MRPLEIDVLDRIIVPVVALAIFTANVAGQPAAKGVATDAFTLKEDVIYARKHGTALTLDVFTPKRNANGRGVILCVSGGWVSDKNMLEINRPVFVPRLIERGYTVFAVFHRSQPQFTNLDAVQDVDVAVKYVRKHAKEFGVDPARLGATGMSAGGHLSLMQASARGDGRVAAVGCFCPPTDFLNYGEAGASEERLKPLAAVFDYRKFADGKLVSVAGDERIALLKRASPVHQVSKDSAPTLVLHGSADFIVPIQQSELIMAKYKEAGVPFQLVARKGQGHGWPKMSDDVGLIADWFDKHLDVGK